MVVINKWLDWITRLAYLNVLWIVFSLLGLVIFGLFPATAATFSVARNWITGKTDVAVFPSFWQAYKQEFVKSNLLGYVLTVLGYILYLDFVFITVSPGRYVGLLAIPFLLITFLFILTAFYAFPTFVYYEMKTFQVIKNAFFIMIMNPLPTLTMVIGSGGIIFILWTFQGLAIFFSISLLAVVIMMPAHRAFTKVSEKQHTYLQNQT
ncbi:YesL family protein [Aquibacillus kalidii]|uniref:YesL family protein n=1 Tax=Aquibacillus kalidii TaxID=2762597 RepID=UPI0016480792|nr:YesL family protein [Aquibacillus kalidii]